MLTGGVQRPFGTATMPRKGKEPERQRPFRKGAVDPPLGGFPGEEAESAQLPPLDWTDDPGSESYGASQAYNHFPPVSFPLDAQLTPEWAQPAGMEGYSPADNASGA